MSQLEYRTMPARFSAVDSGLGGVGALTLPRDPDIQAAIVLGYTNEYQADVVSRSIEYFSMSRAQYLELTRTAFSNDTNLEVAKFLYYTGHILEATPLKTLTPHTLVRDFLSQKGRNIPVRLSPNDKTKFAREFYSVKIQRSGFMNKLGYFGVNRDGTLLGVIFDLDEVGNSATYRSSGRAMSLKEYSAEMSDLAMSPNRQLLLNP